MEQGVEDTITLILASGLGTLDHPLVLAQGDRVRHVAPCPRRLS